MESGLNSITKVYQEQAREIDDILSEFVVTSTLLSSFIVEGQNDLSPVLERANTLLERSDSFLASLDQNRHIAAMKQFITKLKQYEAGVISLSQELTATGTGDGFRSAERALLQIEKETHSSGENLKHEIFNDMGNLSDSLLRQMKTGKRLSITIGIIGVLSGAFIAVLILYSISIPIKKMISFSTAIADGDLSHKLEKISDKEIGLLFSSANTMSEKLQHLINNIRETSLEIQTTALAMSKSSGKLSDGAKHQNEMIDNVASAFTQMAQITSEINSKTKDLNASLQDSSSSLYELTASIKEISSFADKAFQEVDKITSSHLEINSTMGNTLGFLDKLARTSQQASASTSDLTTAITETGKRAMESEKLTNEVSIMAKENGVQALERMINVSRKNKDLVDDYSKIIKSLGSKSANIGKILDVIYNVVDQSSLLSLNAAIIAAQAGEHGKSFAVVADEVRKLSNTTTVNLKQIEEVVQGVMSEVEEAVNMIDGITKGMDSSILAAEQANNILNMIEEISAQSTEMAGEITASVKKQVNYCNDIHESVLNNSKQVDQIKEVMNAQKKGSDLIVNAVEEIRTIAEQLKNSTLEQSNGSAIISQTTSETQSFSEKLVRAIDGQQDANRHTVESLEEISNITSKNLETLKDLDSISNKLGSLNDRLTSNISRFKLPQ